MDRQEREIYIYTSECTPRAPEKIMPCFSQGFRLGMGVLKPTSTWHRPPTILSFSALKILTYVSGLQTHSHPNLSYFFHINSNNMTFCWFTTNQSQLSFTPSGLPPQRTGVPVSATTPDVSRIRIVAATCSWSFTWTWMDRMETCKQCKPQDLLIGKSAKCSKMSCQCGEHPMRCHYWGIMIMSILSGEWIIPILHW